MTRSPFACFHEKPVTDLPQASCGRVVLQPELDPAVGVVDAVRRGLDRWPHALGVLVHESQLSHMGWEHVEGLPVATGTMPPSEIRLVRTPGPAGRRGGRRLLWTPDGRVYDIDGDFTDR